MEQISSRPSVPMKLVSHFKVASVMPDGCELFSFEDSIILSKCLLKSNRNLSLASISIPKKASWLMFSSSIRSERLLCMVARMFISLPMPLLAKSVAKIDEMVIGSPTLTDGILSMMLPSENLENWNSQ